MTHAKAQIARQFLAVIPHSQSLGMIIDAVDDGIAVMSMPYDARFVGDPTTGVLHGGVVAALMDTCCGTAVMTHPSGPIGTATIDLRIDYMRAAKPGQRLVARAECHHVTRSVAFVRAVAHDDDADNPVAMVNGAFTIERSKGDRT